MASSLSSKQSGWRRLKVLQCWFLLLVLLPLPDWVMAQTNPAVAIILSNNLLVMIQGKVEVARTGTDAWSAGHLNQVLYSGDRVRTGERSRAGIFLAVGMTIEKGELAELEIPPSPGTTFKKGLFKIFNFEKTRGSKFQLPGASAAIRGTDFLVDVSETGRSEVTVLDGEVVLSNAAGEVGLGPKERGIVEGAGPPRKTAVIEAINDLIQWSLYYPAVLNPDELELNAAEQTALADSLAAYRAGDLLQALAKYPWSSAPASAASRVYQAALLLSVGQVEKAQAILQAEAGAFAPAQALRELIAAVKFEPWSAPNPPSSSSQWLAESYYQQSRFELEAALRAAQEAANRSPGFGFAWARVAELEFSFGRTERALEALEKGLALSPRNAQAVALKGFLLTARNKIPAAISQFDQAIEVDSALANAWLGRGLSLIRQGQIQNGLKDLAVAASLEPQRSALRSYLGKAFGEARDERHARRELRIATELDRNDPTPWLYLALLDQERNRINEAVTELEHSQELNENRQLFRSRMLLDQDRAVRSANLAAIYRDAGMNEVSVREASSAVVSDYGNYSAHLFLANSYSELRDPNLINLRYETATFSEYLLANLLAPVGATTLSPYVSQQEYSKLFERDRLGLSSGTTYLSNGDWQQEVSLFGNGGNVAAAADVIYRSFNGQRPNNDLRQLVLSPQIKVQLTPADSVQMQLIHNDLRGGDLRQYYDQRSASPTLRIEEHQRPNLFLGYHHEWSPGMHTLLLGARLQDTFDLTDQNVLIRGVIRDDSGQVVDTVEQLCARFNIEPPAVCDTFDSLKFRSEFEAYSMELQQIAQVSKHTLIFGGRYQTGETETHAVEDRGLRFPPYSLDLSGEFVSAQTNTTDLVRMSLYAYDQWQVLESFWLVGGLTYDWLRYGENIDLPPISAREANKDQLSPKAGFIYKLPTDTTVRGAFSRSLGGQFYDTSVRLEPVQLAGFNQAYRSLIPESLEGVIAGARFQTFDLGIEQKFKTRTYLTLQGELLQSEASRKVGTFDFDPVQTNPTVPSQIRQRLDFEESSFIATVNQLLGRDWSVGARYKLSGAILKTKFPPISDELIPHTDDRSQLQQLNLFAIFNHPSGFFAKFHSLWTAQSNYRSTANLPGEDFWQLNVFAGYRFPRRQAELTLGMLNLTDQDYHLNPVNLYGELPRERTFYLSFKFNF